MVRMFALASKRNAIWLVVAACSVLAVSSQTWEAAGEIDGDVASEKFGEAISLSSDGSRLAIASNQHNSSRGRVAVYEKSGDSWTQLGETIYGGESGALMGYGISLSADGNRLAIGAYKSATLADEGGKVDVYEYSSGSWSQLGASLAGATAYDWLGYSVSLSSDGSRLAIGAPYALVGDTYAGRVRVYEYSNGLWTQLGGDNMVSDVSEAYKGESIQLSADGTRIVIGVPYESPNGDYSGVARVYDYADNAWSQVGADINGGQENDYAGYEVAISADGSRVAVSIPLNLGIGKARVYELDNGAWSQVGSDLEGETSDGYIGYGMALNEDGSRFVVSEPWNSEAGQFRGRVWIYDLGSDGAWTETAKYDGLVNNDEMGTALSLSSDGKHLAFSSPKHDEAAQDAGRIYVYELVDPTTAAPTTAAPTTAAPAGDDHGDHDHNEDGNTATVHHSSLFVLSTCILAIFFN